MHTLNHVTWMKWWWKESGGNDSQLATCRERLKKRRRGRDGESEREEEGTNLRCCRRRGEEAILFIHSIGESMNKSLACKWMLLTVLFHCIFFSLSLSLHLSSTFNLNDSSLFVPSLYHHQEGRYDWHRHRLTPFSFFHRHFPSSLFLPSDASKGCLCERTGKEKRGKQERNGWSKRLRKKWERFSEEVEWVKGGKEWKGERERERKKREARHSKYNQ